MMRLCLVVAGGTEPPTLAGEGQQVFVLAVIAANAGEALFQGPALEEFFDDFRHDGAEGTQFGFVGFWVVREEGRVVTLDALPQGGFAGIA